jgi:hypothetical protein
MRATWPAVTAALLSAAFALTGCTAGGGSAPSLIAQLDAEQRAGDRVALPGMLADSVRYLATTTAASYFVGRGPDGEYCLGLVPGDDPSAASVHCAGAETLQSGALAVSGGNVAATLYPDVVELVDLAPGERMPATDLNLVVSEG